MNVTAPLLHGSLVCMSPNNSIIVLLVLLRHTLLLSFQVNDSNQGPVFISVIYKGKKSKFLFSLRIFNTIHQRQIMMNIPTKVLMISRTFKCQVNQLVLNKVFRVYIYFMK